jgi:hypothetical protein
MHWLWQSQFSFISIKPFEIHALDKERGCADRTFSPNTHFVITTVQSTPPNVEDNVRKGVGGGIG